VFTARYGLILYIGCPTRYRTRHFFNNSNTNEDIATKFKQEYVRCVRNEKECVCSAPNCCDTEQRSASQPGSVASATLCIKPITFRLKSLLWRNILTELGGEEMMNKNLTGFRHHVRTQRRWLPAIMCLKVGTITDNQNPGVEI